MNHGWYEIMDRIHIIQNTLDDNVRNHRESDEQLRHLIDAAQEMLSEAYNYAGIKWDESFRDFEEGY
jgi:hypothetical protein